MVKKLILSILIILSIFNCIAFQKTVFASDELKDENFEEVMEGVPDNSMDSMLNDGESTASPNGQTTKKKIKSSPSFGGATASLLARILNVIPSIMNIVMSYVINSQQTSSGNIEFTIYDLLQNEYDLFNINFFSVPSNGSSVRKIISENIAVWFYGVRNLAVGISLLILIYVGIRMAGSTLAVDKAKYMELAMYWVKAFCLIFVMQYIILIAINLSNTLIEAIPDNSDNIENAIIYGDSGTQSNPSEESIAYKLENFKGWNYVAISVLYFVIVYYQFKFFILYFKRTLVIGFMTIISPLVCITFPIDSISDGKAQGFDKWLKELLVNIFIQPIHLIIYSVIIFCAGEIIELAPVLAILFFVGLSRAEKVVKNVLGLRDRTSIHSLSSIKIQHRS